MWGSYMRLHMSQVISTANRVSLHRVTGYDEKHRDIILYIIGLELTLLALLNHLLYRGLRSLKSVEYMYYIIGRQHSGSWWT